MRSPKPVPAVVAILRGALEAAESGEITGVFLLQRHREGAYDSELFTTDLDDLAFQLRSEVMRLRSRG